MYMYMYGGQYTCTCILKPCNGHIDMTNTLIGLSLLYCVYIFILQCKEVCVEVQETFFKDLKELNEVIIVIIVVVIVIIVVVIIIVIVIII